MTSRLTNICLDAADPPTLAHFWCAVLGWEIADESDGGVSIAPVDRAWPVIDIFPVPEPKVHKNRLHLDIRADGSSTREELERLLGLGASTVDVGQSPEATWVVLADPEGNEFCLLATSVQDFVR
jgi:catechol 2,3-dioxygenase-like lactoylglutathione lyase family enzyme